MLALDEAAIAFTICITSIYVTAQWHNTIVTTLSNELMQPLQTWFSGQKMKTNLRLHWNTSLFTHTSPVYVRLSQTTFLPE